MTDGAAERCFRPISWGLGFEALGDFAERSSGT